MAAHRGSVPKVILPLVAPGIFTTAIIAFTGTTGFDTPCGTIMAARVFVTVPLLLAVLIFQRCIVAGLVPGGVKRQHRTS